MFHFRIHSAALLACLLAWALVASLAAGVVFVAWLVAVGVAAAMIVGFVVVHFFAAGREAERYGAIITELERTYAQVNNSAEAHRGLQEARRHAQTTLEDRRSTIVIMSSVLWLVVGGVLLFVWLRLIDWTRWREHGVSAPS